MNITDWNGQEINVGDTVLYTAGGDYRGLTYGKVTRIDVKGYDTFVYANGYQKAVENRVRVRVEPIQGYSRAATTIIQGLHPVAFASITKFRASENVGV